MDDLTLAIRGSPHWIIQLLAEVTEFVIAYLQGDLRMQVSAKKSKLLASKPSIAIAICDRIGSGIGSATFHAKLLGTDAVGGTRRSTTTFQSRLTTFRDNRSRFQSLCESGVDTMQMVRAAGPPSILYGVETIGLSDSQLATSRSSVATAASASGAGKNPDIALLIIDCPSGTLDPMFDVS